MQQLTEEQKKELQDKLEKMSPEEIREFQKKQCIFCQIIADKVPSKKIHEDDKSIAVLDINPATKGHVLLLPKEHYSIMPQVPSELMGDLFITAKEISQKILRSLKVPGTNIFIANGLVAGQNSPHIMVHIIPRKEGDQILNLDEKLIEKDLQDKVIVSIQNKLNELLGIKKEVVHIEEDRQKDSESDKVEDTLGEDEQDQVKDDNEDEPEDEINEDQDSESDDGEEEDKDNSDVSLDDIANLFK